MNAARLTSPFPENHEPLRHPLEGPLPFLRQRFHPFGFPVDVSTNSAIVLRLLDDMWGKFTARFQKEAIRCEIIVGKSGETRCPPEPRYHIQLPLLTTICDGDHFSIADLDRGTVTTHITEAALQYPLFTSYFLLSAAYSCICTRYTTPIHAACVSWNSRGILLCGESGAGKSSLAYSCAQHGWVYTADDASYLINHERIGSVTGNCYQFRLRPESAKLFPEISSLKMTARAAGKPSVEVPTSRLKRVVTAPVANVNYIVFLNRKHQGSPFLVPFSTESARESMVQSLYGPQETLQVQHHAIDRLLEAPVFELRYNTLDEARRLLQTLAEEDVNAGHNSSVE